MMILGSSGDPCGAWTSYIDSVGVTAGSTYYVVVDGWGGDAGNYQLDVYYRGDTIFQMAFFVDQCCSIGV